MNKTTAKAIIELLARHAGEQNELLKDIEKTEFPKEFERVKNMIAHTMGAIYLEALNPLFAEFPGLKPPHLR